MVKNNPVRIANEQEENQQIKKDLVFVVVLNTVFLAILFGLYFFNHSTGKVDVFFAHLLKF